MLPALFLIAAVLFMRKIKSKLPFHSQKRDGWLNVFIFVRVKRKILITSSRHAQGWILI